MPRGQRKRGALDCRLWLPDGASLRFTTRPERVFTTAELCQLLREKIVEPLEKAQSLDAVDPSAADPGTPSTREK